MPLFDRRDEPFGRVDLVFDELDRLLVRIVGRLAVPGHHAADHLHIAAVHFQVGYVRSVQAQFEHAVLVVENEVGRDIGLHLVASPAVQVARFGRKADDLFDCIPELILVDTEARHQFFVMLLGKFVEIVGQDLHRHLLFRGMIGDRAQLEQQALLQVAGAHPRRFQFVDDLQELFQLLFVGFDAEAERDVVGDGIQVAAQVTVFVDTPDQVFGQGLVVFAEVLESELLDEAFVKRNAFGDIDRSFLIVFRIVVDPVFVAGRIVFGKIFLDRHLFGFLFFVCRFLFFEYRVLFDLLFDALFELKGRQFE